jgi:hypothetical protein
MIVKLFVAAAIASAPLAPVAAKPGPGAVIENKKDVCIQKCTTKGIPYQRCIQVCL